MRGVGSGSLGALLAARRTVPASLAAVPTPTCRAAATAADAAASSPASPSSLAARLAQRFAKACLLIYAVTHHVGFPSLVTGPSMFPAFAASGEVVLAECLPGLPSRVRKGDVVICVRPVDASQHIVKRVAAVAGERVVVYPPPPSPVHYGGGGGTPSSSSSSPSSPSSSALMYTGGAPELAGGRGEEEEVEARGAEEEEAAAAGARRRRGGGVGAAAAAASGRGGAASRRRPAPVRLTVPPGHVWVQGDNLAVSRDSREYGPVPLGTVRGRVLCTVWPWPRAVDPGPAEGGGGGVGAAAGRRRR